MHATWPHARALEPPSRESLARWVATSLRRIKRTAEFRSYRAPPRCWQRPVGIVLLDRNPLLGLLRFRCLRQALVRMPLAKVASILSISTPSGTWKERSNVRSDVPGDGVLRLVLVPHPHLWRSDRDGLLRRDPDRRCRRCPDDPCRRGKDVVERRRQGSGVPNAIVGPGKALRLYEGLFRKYGDIERIVRQVWIDGLPGYISLYKGTPQTTSFDIDDGRIVAIYKSRTRRNFSIS